MALTVETLAEAMHEGRSDIPWEATSQQDSAFRDARAVLTTIEQAGYVVVPMEATPEMRAVGEREMMARHANLDSFRDPYVDSTWSAMITAAPKIGGE